MKVLQVLGHLMLFQVIVPAVALVFFKELMVFSNFDPFDTKDLTTELFKLETDQETEEEHEQVDHDEHEDHLEDNGYESYYMLLNLGSPLYFFIAQFIYTPLFFIVSIILRKCGTPRTKKVADWLSK